MKGKSTQIWTIILPVVFSILLLLVRPVFSQSQPQEKNRYEGKIVSSEVYKHEGKTYTGLCPREQPAEFVLNADGTLVLSYNHPKISFRATDKGVTCTVSTDAESNTEVEIRGTYNPASSTFTFDSFWAKPANEWIQISEAAGSGDFTANNARGQLIFVVFGAETHINFDMPAVAAAAPTASKGCFPQPRGLTPAKPGDIISPGADYFDVDGKETGIIQERWYFNGKQGASIIWDGNPVQVELQWTCLDNSGHVKEFLIPAYQEVLAEDTQVQTTAVNNTIPKITITMPTGTAILITVATIGVGGLITGIIIRGIKRVMKPTSESSSGQDASSSPTETSQPDSHSGTDPGTFENTKRRTWPSNLKKSSKSSSGLHHESGKPSAPEKPSTTSGQQAKSKPTSPPSTGGQKIELVNIRSEMQTELENLTEKYNKFRQARETLRNLLKKNMYKFLMKKGLDVTQWVTSSPVEVINNVALDPVTEKVFEKHDTSKDGDIIVQINNRIEKLGEEMRQIEQEAKYLKNEIKTINQKLAGK